MHQNVKRKRENNALQGVDLTGRRGCARVLGSGKNAPSFIIHKVQSCILLVFMLGFECAYVLV